MTFKHELYDIPKIKRIDSPSGRTYETPDGTFKSVTTLLSNYDKQSLVDWKNRVGEEKAAQISSLAAAKGNILHGLCEKFLMNEDVDLSDVLFMDRIRFNNVKECLKKNITCVRGVEVGLYSKTLKLAGSTDLLCDWNGVEHIADFKTSSKVKRKEWISGYFIQLTCYSLMLEELTGRKVEDLIVIMSVEEDDKVYLFPEKRKNWYAPLKDLLKEYNS